MQQKRMIIRMTCLALLFCVLLCALASCASPTEDKPKERAPIPDVVDPSDAQYTYEDMEEDLLALAAYYPHWIRVASAGQTYDGREIYYADIGSAAAPRQIMINAGIHGREYMTPLLLMEQTEQYLIRLAQEAADPQRATDTDVMIRMVPMINPDGIAISQQGLQGLRNDQLKSQVIHIFDSDQRRYGYDQHYATIGEYLVHWKANAKGVDLNRNFGIEAWSEVETGIRYPSSQRYKGESPNSEPETQALIRLTESLTAPICAVSLHSQGEILYWDCGQQGRVREQTLALAKAIQGMNGYRLQDTFEHPDASYNDWCTLQQGIPSLNIETGKGMCPLPHEQFVTVWAQNQNLWQVLLSYCSQVSAEESAGK